MPELSFQEKTQLVTDLRSTFTIWDRDHGIREAMFIATGGGQRYKNVQDAIGFSVEAIGAEAGVRRIIDHAIRRVQET